MKDRRNFLKHTLLGALGFTSFSQLRSSTPTTPVWANARSDEQLFALIKKDFFLPDNLIYLNTGSLGPCPRSVVSKITTAMAELESNPVTHNWGDLGNRMEGVREKAAQFLNAEKEALILTRNTTEGINLVGSCLRLQPGDEILTTDQEHGGGENGLFYLAERQGAKVRKIEMPLGINSKEEIINLVKENITSKTKVLLLSHVSTITGLCMPLAEIAAFTRPQEILLIADGAQAPGMIRVDMEALGVDIYSTSGHKWLLGPKETGILYIRPAVQVKIMTAFTRSGYSAYSASSGTRNVATWIGLGETLDWQQTIGLERIEQRCLSLATYCREKLKGMSGLKIISPNDPALATGIVSIQLTEANNRTVFEELRKQQIIVKLLPQDNALRFSLHIFNSKAEIDQLAEALPPLLS